MYSTLLNMKLSFGFENTTLSKKNRRECLIDSPKGSKDSSMYFHLTRRVLSRGLLKKVL